MRTLYRQNLVCLIFFMTAPLSAASLPSNLSSEEVGRAIQIFGVGSGMRLLRSSEALPDWPGFKAGVELTFQPMKNINSLGNANGTLPSLFPMPRFYFAKGLGHGGELLIGTFPFIMRNTVATYGALLKWTVRPEDEYFLATAVFAGYTRMLALNNSLRAHTLEVGISVSKDYVRLRPYGGVAFALSVGDVGSGSGLTRSGTVNSFKLFAGFELELPMSLSVQLDFLDLLPSASVLVGFRL